MTARALKGTSSGNTSRNSAASSTLWRRASSTTRMRASGATATAAGAREVWSRLIGSAHQSGAAEEALGTNQKNDRHQEEDRDLRHLGRKERRQADHHADQQPGQDRAH